MLESYKRRNAALAKFFNADKNPRKLQKFLFLICPLAHLFFFFFA